MDKGKVLATVLVIGTLAATMTTGIYLPFYSQESKQRREKVIQDREKKLKGDAVEEEEQRKKHSNSMWKNMDEAIKKSKQ